MSDPTPWLTSVRRSHDRLTGLVTPLAPEQLGGPSACSEWSVAQVLSHLGSQAEIFSLFVDAGVSGGDPPPQDAFTAIWDVWNARSPEEQARESTAANEALVSRLEGLSDAVLDGFRLEMFGMTLDAAGLLRLRLGEHAVHTWDVAVALDPTAEVAADAVALLAGGLGDVAARSGRPPASTLDVTVTTADPELRFRLHAADAVTLEPSAADGDPADGVASVRLPAAALVRLVYGRLDGNHPAQGPVDGDGVTVEELTAVFPGF